MYWQSLQARLQNRPASYADVSTIALKVTVGGRLSAQSDRKVNITPTRNYDTGNTRSVSAAFKHLANSAGMTSFDTATVDALESAYWTPQGIKFDYIADDDKASVKDILDIIAAAGRGYLQYQTARNRGPGHCQILDGDHYTAGNDRSAKNGSYGANVR